MAQIRKKTGKQSVRRDGMNFKLFFVAIALLCVGCLMVLSSSYAYNIRGGENAFGDFIQHLVVGIVGIGIMLLLSSIDYRILNHKLLVLGAVAACVLLLAAVYAFPDKLGAHRWIPLFGFTLQPSEFAKFVLSLYLAYFISHNKYWFKDIKKWIQLMIPVVVFAALIVFEPNLSTTLICILLPTVIVMFVSGMQKWLVGVAGIAVAVLGVWQIFFTDWRAGRVGAWMDPFSDPRDTGYQVVQSLYALGDGNLWGVGMGNSRQKVSALPMADTDYIYSIIGEEFGFIGAVFVLLLYAVFIWIGMKTAMNAPDAFGQYLATGITSVFALQTLVNIAVVTNTIPSTGVTLPFISRGSSSLLAFSCATGLLLSISAYSKRRRPVKKTAEPEVTVEEQKQEAEIIQWRGDRRQ